ncbi:MAG: hypothetical protein GYA52_10295 [Chloroflexi bacterium]|nr:hypothetical protein [Chloroflexota bacterium]
MPDKINDASLLPSLPDSQNLKIRKPYPGLRILVFIGIIYGIIISLLGAAANATGENIAIFFALILCGGYTLALYFTRRLWIPPLTREHAWRNAGWIAFANAVLVKAAILFLEQILQSSTATTGLPALLNLLLTLPWYAGLIYFFIQIQQKNHYHWAVVLLLAGLYEFILNLSVNGIVLPWLAGQPVTVVNSFLELFLTGYWQFVIINSPIFLVIAWILEELPQPALPPKRSSWQIFRPLLWIFPYLLYFVCFYLLGQYFFPL